MGIISNAPFAISTTPEGDRIMTLATSHEDDNVIKIDHEIKKDETDQKDGGEPYHEEEQEISSISFRKLEEKMGFAVRTTVTTLIIDVPSVDLGFLLLCSSIR